MDSPCKRIDRIGRILPDEIRRMNVTQISGDRDEVVDSARLEESFLRVQPQLDGRDAVAVENHVKVSP